MSNINNQILFQGQVIDSKDPLMLGRIRAYDVSRKESNLTDSVPNWNEEKDAWTSKDPTIFHPLLPFYLNIQPQKDELILILYTNKDYPTQNQFYIPGYFSSPMASMYEHYEASKKILSSGDLIKDSTNIKNTDNTYKNKESEGVFPEPLDNGLLGRGSADIIIKEDELLIRAGKVKTLEKSKLPIGNTNRAFLQLSRFPTTRVPGNTETNYNSSILNVPVLKMITWNIKNLDNQQDRFTGNVSLYSIIPSEKTKTENFKINTIENLSDGIDYKGPLESISFQAIPLNDAVNIINNFINDVFNSFKNVKYPLNSKNLSADPSTTFPFVVTPSYETYKKGIKFGPSVSDNDIYELENYTKFYNRIKPNGNSSPNTGFFIVSSNDNGNFKLGSPIKLSVEDVNQTEVLDTDITYGTLGAQKIYLLSHDSDGPKGKISLSNTLYGIGQDKFVSGEENKSIYDKTYPMVRGDKLIELLRKIVNFISGHVHPIATEVPIPIASGTGQSIAEINSLLADAENIILNENIRIN